MSLSASGGDRTKYAHVISRFGHDRYLNSDEIDNDRATVFKNEHTVEAQEDRNILGFHFSGGWQGPEDADTDEWSGIPTATQEIFAMGNYNVALGQSRPVAPEPSGEGGIDIRSDTRMPISHRYGWYYVETSAENTSGANTQGLSEVFLTNPQEEFLWQQGETLFIDDEIFTIYDISNDQRYLDWVTELVVAYEEM